MKAEEEIVNNIKNKFPQFSELVTIQRARRIWLKVPYESFEEVLNFLVKDLTFSSLCTITGTDDGEMLGVVCHIARKDGIVLNLKTQVPKSNPVWKSICTVFPGSTFYEREIADLLGFKVEGLPPGKRYPLPDDWPEGEYPLRKDWQPKE